MLHISEAAGGKPVEQSLAPKLSKAIWALEELNHILDLN